MKTGLLSTLAAVCMLCLCACSNSDFDEFRSNGGPDKPVFVSITAENPGDAPASRAILAETPSHRTVKSTWEVGDVVYAYNVADGRGVGTLKAVSRNEAGKTSFEGSLFIEDGDEVYFYYLGNEPDRTDKKHLINLEDQDGTLESMTDFNYLASTPVKFSIIDDVAKADPMKFHIMLSYVHFEITFDDSYNYKGEPITVSGKNLKKNTTIDLTTAELINSEEEALYTFNTSDIYMAVAPNEDIEFDFSVTINGVTYNGAYDKPITMVAGNYYTRKGEPVPIKFIPEAHLDGSIRGVTWTAYNLRSWLDMVADQGPNPEAYAFSYIPEIPLAEQGVQLHFNSEAYINANNNFFYHFQWGRDFGFIGTTDSYANTWVMLPNFVNSPWSEEYSSYDARNERQTYNNVYSSSYYHIFYFPLDANYPDWCSRGALSKWAPNAAQEIIAVNSGYHIPTLDELRTLVPVSGVSRYTLPTRTIESEYGTARPFYSEAQGDGTTIIWAITNPGPYNFLDVRRVIGDADYRTIEAELYDSGDGVMLPCAGARSAWLDDDGIFTDGLEFYAEAGFYWSSTGTGQGIGAGRAACLVIDTTEENIVNIYCSHMPRKYGMSVRMVRD